MDVHTRILNDHTKILNEHTQRLTAIEGRLDDHTRILEQIPTELKAIRENTAAMLALYRRLDYRDHVFSDKLGLDLYNVDTAA